MGVLSDLVVANEADAERVAHTQVPSQAFGGIDVKGIDSVRFATLHSILTGRSFEELLPSYEPAFSASDDGPWVFRLPDELVTRLANLTDSERQSIAERWAATEEFELDDWDATMVAETFEAICGQAANAESTKRALFLWMCL
jgi:hypothetical protein